MNTNLCPTCKSPIPADAPGGYCPACILRDADDGLAGGRTAPSLDEVAAAFPQLEVLELIGQGGMGFVYKVRQPSLDRTVALKILSPELGRDPAFAERFAREARVLGKLSHPNIVTVFESGESGGFFYLIMEFVDGVNLRQAMRAGRFTPAQALAVVPGICDALAAAHAQGVWHRDIKPANLMLVANGHEETTKVVDFGIASEPGGKDATLAGLVLGTPNYAAPEQLLGRRVTPAADVYALGCTLYELLTGAAPFEAQSLGEVIDGHLHGTPTPLARHRPDVPPEVARLVHSMLEKDPARRPADGLAVFDALSRPGPTVSATGVLVGLRTDDAAALHSAIARAGELGLELTRVQGRSLLLKADAAELGFQAAERLLGAVAGAAVLHAGPLDEDDDGPTTRSTLELLRLAPPGAVVVTRVAHGALGLGFRSRLSSRRQRLVEGGPAGSLTIFELPGTEDVGHAATLVRGMKTNAGVDFSCGCGTRGHVPSLSAGRARVRCAGCSGLLEVVAAEAEALELPQPRLVTPALVDAADDADEDALILASLSSLTGAPT